MGVFESKLKDHADMSLVKAFGGDLPTGISEAKATELWARYDENGDGSLDMKEAKHMVVDLAELTVQWAKSNIAKILEEVTSDGDQDDSDKKVQEQNKQIDLAYKLMKDDDIINQIIKDFDTDGDGQVSKEEFLAKATEGYSILQPAKKAKTIALRVHETLEVDGTSLSVYKEVVGPSVYVSIGGFFPQDTHPPFCMATISPHGLVSVSGQIGRVPGKGTLISGGLGAQTTQCLENIKLILKCCGCSMEHVLKVNVFVKKNDGNNEPGGRMHEMNKAYCAFFEKDSHHLPARSRAEAGGLALGAEVMIDVQATLEK